MQCPVCPESTLLMTHRQGVDIDYCAKCRGVWLDRGELDKLIELAGTHEPGRADTHRAPAPSVARRDFDDSDFGKRHRSGYRQKSWLSDLFD